MKPFAILFVTSAFALSTTTSAWSDVVDQLAGEIETRVREATGAERPPGREASVVEFLPLAPTASWTEVWPGPDGGEVTHAVEAKLWNAPIQTALAKHDAVFLPERDEPYYIDNPIILKSGQRLCADRKAEIRLVPGTDTCMVRNEHLVSGRNGPVPADAEPDTRIAIEGGIWTTLATGPAQSNGNIHGRAARQPTASSHHGVILLSNVRGVVVRNVAVRQSRAHAVQLSNCRDFLVDGVGFDEHRRDGIHVNGPANYGVIRNVRGVTGDDVVALTAWDWCNTGPTFGPIHHVLAEAIYGNPHRGGTDEIRLLPGTKAFADGTKLDCPIHDCVFRDLRDIRTIKIYDQPNLELGRHRDFCDPIGTVRNIYFDKLAFNRACRIQVAVHVDGLSINDVRLNFDVDTPGRSDYRLVELGPMSQTYKFDPNDPSRWVELFSPDRDVTIRGFQLTNVSVRGVKPPPQVEARLVEFVDQKPNPDYPKTTPRGGTGKVILVP